MVLVSDEKRCLACSSRVLRGEEPLPLCPWCAELRLPSYHERLTALQNAVRNHLSALDKGGFTERQQARAVLERLVGS